MHGLNVFFMVITLLPSLWARCGRARNADFQNMPIRQVHNSTCRTQTGCDPGILSVMGKVQQPRHHSGGVVEFIYSVIVVPYCGGGLFPRTCSINGGTSLISKSDRYNWM